MSSGATTSDGALERVVNDLARRRARLVDQVVSDACALPGYDRLDSSQVGDLRETVDTGFAAIVQAMAEHRSFGEKDVDFLRPHIRRRTTAGVTQAEMLTVVRTFERVMWGAIADAAGSEDDTRVAAFVLARPLIEYIDVLSGVVSEAFAETQEALASRASVLRAQLVEQLLAGGELVPGSALNLARESGLGDHSHLLVIVARAAGAEADYEVALPIAARALAGAARGAATPLIAFRGRDVVIVRATTETEVVPFAQELARAVDRLAEEGIALMVGGSAIQHGYRKVPDAYREACLALERVDPRGGVLTLATMPPLDYLLLRAGDRTAWRLVPPAVRTFVEEDARQQGPLREAVLIFAECDLNVKLAAERMYVHPNTVHYRLSRIEERTGLNARRFADLLVLVLAIRLCDPSPPIHSAVW